MPFEELTWYTNQKHNGMMLFVQIDLTITCRNIYSVNVLVVAFYEINKQIRYQF